MMDRTGFLYERFQKRFKREPTPCQDALFLTVARFITGDDGDILVVNGYAGTGKTSAMAAVIAALRDVGTPSVLLAPTGRAAKVFSQIATRPASTIHKHIYRQKSGPGGSNSYGSFSLAPNKAKHTLFVVDEASLIGIDSQANASAAFGSGNLLEDLVNFVRAGADCRLILIGDAAQLPPVGLEASPVFSPYMDGFGGVSHCELSTVVRQEHESGILRNATLLRRMISSAGADDTFDHIGFDLQGVDDIVRIGGGELIDALSDAYSKYGEDGTIVLCRSNKKALRYNLGIRSMVQYKEERLTRGDKLMIVKNCYQFLEDIPQLDYIANGDIATLEKISSYEERYGLHFAKARLCFPDYDDVEIEAKVCLDALDSESASLSQEQQEMLYQGVWADYEELGTKKKIWSAVREDKYFNALQLKYAEAITCHKSQGGQWDCVFVDCPFWLEEQSVDDLKWLYTAITRAVKKVYLVNFKDRFFKV